MQESAGLGLVGVSRDTTSIRAEARRVEIAVNRKLGRINSWPREGKLGDRPCAQFLDEEHGGAFAGVGRVLQTSPRPNALQSAGPLDRAADLVASV